MSGDASPVAEALPTLDPWIAASLIVQAGQVDGPRLARSRAWLLRAADDLAHLPPLGLIIDVGEALSFDRHAGLGVPSFPSPLREAFAEYLEHVVGRLRNDRLRLAASDALAGLPEERRPAAVALLLSNLLTRMRWEGHREGHKLRSRVALRQALSRPIEEIVLAGAEALEDPDVLREVTEELHALSRAARRAGALLQASDVFLIEHLERLGGAAERVAFTQLMNAADRLERSLPSRIASTRTPRGQHATRLEDESTYPAGGFSSISTSGSLENLVSSELVYLEGRAEIDLFDVRFATDELLRFTRDEAVHTRPSRTIAFLLAPELLDARVLDAGQKEQRLTLALALLIAACRRLLHWLDEIDLRIELRHAPSLRSEGHLLALALREPIERGVAVVGALDGAWRAELIESALRRETDAIGIGAPPALPLEHTLHLDLATATPALIETRARQGSTPSPKRAPSSWESALRELLQKLL